MHLQLNLDVLKGGDILFSSASNPLGNWIRVNQTGKLKDWNNLKIPNHGGFFTEDFGQIMVTEMGAFGLKENSPKKYESTRNRIVDVLRWRDLDSNLLHAILADQKAKVKEYSWWGAIKSIPLWRSIFKRVKVKDELDFCTENVAYTLIGCGLKVYPQEWLTNPPNPLNLYLNLRHRSDFYRIGGFYV